MGLLDRYGGIRILKPYGSSSLTLVVTMIHRRLAKLNELEERRKKGWRTPEGFVRSYDSTFYGCFITRGVGYIVSELRIQCITVYLYQYMYYCINFGLYLATGPQAPSGVRLLYCT